VIAGGASLFSPRIGALHQLFGPPQRESSDRITGAFCRGGSICTASAAAPSSCMALPDSDIPKYIEPLPTFVALRQAMSRSRSRSSSNFVMPASVCSDLSAPFGQGTYVCGFRVGNMPPHYPGFTIEAHRDHALGGLAARHRAPNRTLPLGSRNGEVGAPSYRRAQVRTGQWGSSLPLVSRPISIATTLNSAKQTMIAAATLKPPSATASKPAISGPKLVITLAAPLQNATPVDRICVGNSSGK